jgi:hypothetical protein
MLTAIDYRPHRVAPPDAFAPGRIHDAGIFDEKWQLKNQPKAP